MSYNIDRIPSGTYEGYIWMSDASEPVIIDGEIGEVVLDPAANPFIIESQLVSRSKEESYSVKYVDGAYIARYHDLKPLPEEIGICEEKKYFGHRMSGRRLLFRQYWRRVPDPLCEDMEVLQPKELVFAGFISENNR